LNVYVRKRTESYRFENVKPAWDDGKRGMFFGMVIWGVLERNIENGEMENSGWKRK
jgi:hypothetical protein